ncbi:MAG: hypothetical protein ACRBCJ_09245 [Hyphomicrobiaceae bacterium]
MLKLAFQIRASIFRGMVGSSYIAAQYNGKNTELANKFLEISTLHNEIAMQICCDCSTRGHSARKDIKMQNSTKPGTVENVLKFKIVLDLTICF